MRYKRLNYEQLVKQFKEELLEDKDKMTQIEMRLEKRQTDLVNDKRRKFTY